MSTMRQSANICLILIALSLGVAGPGFATEIFTLVTEDGLELFLLDSQLRMQSLDIRSQMRAEITVEEDGALIVTRPDSFAKHFGLADRVQNDQPAIGYRGFHTSPLGRVLSVEGRFRPNLGPATIETAAGSQSAERRFDFGTRPSDYSGWAEGQGFRILSF